MTPMMRLLQSTLLLLSCSTVCTASGDGGPNSPIFNLDNTALEKNLAAIFNKVAHSSATTKRSVPAYDAQVSASTTLSTVPSPLTTTTTTTTTSSIDPLREVPRSSGDRVARLPRDAVVRTTLSRPLHAPTASRVPSPLRQQTYPEGNQLRRPPGSQEARSSA